MQAIRTALQKFEEGCSIEDAKTVCEPEVLSQLFKWKVKPVLQKLALNFVSYLFLWKCSFICL